MPGLMDLHGLGPKRREALAKAGVTDLESLLDCLPRSYLYAQEATPIQAASPGEVCIEGAVKGVPGLQYHGGRSIVRVKVEDSTGEINAFWFNQPWMAKQLTKGQSVMLFGMLQERQGRLSLVNPKIVSGKGIIPQYKPLPGLPGKVFSGFVRQALKLISDCRVESLPDELRHQHNLCGKLDAWTYAHHPESKEQIAKAQRRLAFENLLLYQLAIRLAGPQGSPGPRMINDFTTDEFWLKMPFVPTKAQSDTLKQIIHDMREPYSMRRLVQGDVGSGKTAVAFGAAACAIKSGYQCAMMAPTELLARQHFLNAQKLLAPFGISCGLLIGTMKAAQRREALAAIAAGSWQLIIGTHALNSSNVAFHQLGLVITDEQHRFGVRQRQKLAEQAANITPHILALSATPIPRSLALVLYGDLQVSIMDELPPGRLPVKTRIVPEIRRDDLYDYIMEKARLGEQSYLVCPLVEDSGEGENEKQSATALYRQLTAGPLKDAGIALTYGSQDETEKNRALAEFYSGKAAVLVSTTVIEVGMDVPNATTIVIEDAEMFGLAQLHQLRGRVGRGQKESWCFLLGEANERLNTIIQTNDGFAIAQKDLELRGPGEFLGTRQHGKMMNLYGVSDIKLIEETSRCLDEMKKDAILKEMYQYLSAQAERKYGQRLGEAGLT